MWGRALDKNDIRSALRREYFDKYLYDLTTFNVESYYRISSCKCLWIVYLMYLHATQY